MRKFGYLLGNEKNGVLFLRDKSLLIPVCTLSKAVLLRSTMFRLLEFILENGESGLVRDEVIMKSVWEGYGLRASSSRLWQVMSELKKRLCRLGVDEDFIMRVEGRGYMINTNFYEPLYIRAAYDWLNRFMVQAPQLSGNSH